MDNDINIKNKDIYLDRMSKPLTEKLRVADYFPQKPKKVLDVGCADGSVTLALAKIFPGTKFLGIDLEDGFIKKAQTKAKEENIDNVSFQTVYLRDLLARSDKFDAVVFVSVLHEFYSYGEGISSVLKALADAHELLEGRGEIIIRDMILNEYTKETDFQVEPILGKIKAQSKVASSLKDFEDSFGELKDLNKINHFLLKYMYAENWDRELKEEYVPVTFEQYQNIFSLLGMDMQLQDSYLIPFLENKWREDFGLTDPELRSLRSTGFLVAQKK